ncbi:hypothetical protein OESDEN_19042 [Oesophagostomum dentatum]|uniref:Uncharacterized protein n=1 Tax=Oesophagostomum dentatum TaxID=61180 RepID=A0A0B1SCK3_OESDE|nr:hypothetical protein OESDEN_19042 [Oesophagostomum dentatum]
MPFTAANVAASGLIPLPPAFAMQTLGGMPTAAMPPMPSAIPPPPSSVPEGAPPPKRQRTEDELEPEAEWLKKVSGAIDLRIQLPVSPEFNMDGSIIGLQIDVASQVRFCYQLTES